MLETFQDYNFQNHLQVGHFHGNAEIPRLLWSGTLWVLSVHRGLEHCKPNGISPLDHPLGLLQVPSPTAAGNNSLETIYSQKLWVDQSQNPIQNLIAKPRTGWKEVSALYYKIKALYTQQTNLTIWDGLLHPSSQGPSSALCPIGVMFLEWHTLGPIMDLLARVSPWFRAPCSSVWLLHCSKGQTWCLHAQLQQYQIGALMKHVGIDIFGSFPTSDQGNYWVLAAMDYFTKWLTGFPDQSAPTSAQHLVSETFCHSGVPEELHSDQGHNFEAQVFVEVCWRLRIKNSILLLSSDVLD